MPCLCDKKCGLRPDRFEPGGEIPLQDFFEFPAWFVVEAVDEIIKKGPGNQNDKVNS